jgi:hypothetical protein
MTALSHEIGRDNGDRQPHDTAHSLLDGANRSSRPSPCELRQSSGQHEDKGMSLTAISSTHPRLFRSQLERRDWTYASSL